MSGLTALIIRSVQPNADAITGHCGRSGTIRGLTLADLAERLGPPHCRGDGDKVTAIYYFDTPRGPIEIRDYWWNKPDEISICGPTKPTQWLAAYFRRLGFRAGPGLQQ